MVLPDANRAGSDTSRRCTIFTANRPGVRIARKHLGWYAKDRPEHSHGQRAAFRSVVNRAETAQMQLRLTRDYFDALAAGVAPDLPAAA